MISSLHQKFFSPAMKKRTHNKLNRNFLKKRGLDKLNVHERSRRMSLIHSESTRFEKDFIAILKKQTRKVFTTNDTSILGRPDIAFKKYKVCVFLDSNFWHGWQYPRWKRSLKNDFWREKIERNRRRDALVTRTLKRQGWKVVRIWEHQIKKTPEKVIEKVTISLK